MCRFINTSIILLILNIWLVLGKKQIFKASDFCAIQDNPPCKYGCNFCTKAFYPVHRNLTEGQKLLITNRINKYRNRVALGYDAFEYGLPGSSDMHRVIWSNELQFLADCWAHQCDLWLAGEGRFSKQVYSQGGQKVGKLIAKNCTRSSELDRLDVLIVSLIDEIYNQRENINQEDLYLYNKVETNMFTPEKGNIITLLWSRMVLIGCSLFSYSNLHKRCSDLICYFYPHINLDFGADGVEMIYKPGEPATMCSRNESIDFRKHTRKRQQSSFPGLCVTSEFFSRMGAPSKAPSVLTYKAIKDLQIVIIIRLILNYIYNRIMYC